MAGDITPRQLYEHITGQQVNIKNVEQENAALRAERDDLASELHRVNSLCNSLRAEVERLQEVVEYYKKRDTLHYPIKARMILYNDTIEGNECHRDDMWAVTTQELNEMHDKETKLSAEVERLQQVETNLRNELKRTHCVDCCCARSWKALGISENTGKSIPEHISALRAERDEWKECNRLAVMANLNATKERDDLAADLKNIRSKNKELSAELTQVYKMCNGLRGELGAVQSEAQKDYDDMRRFQAKFIDADQERRKLRSELDAARAELNEHLPKGLMLEYTRLDSMWQKLVSDRDTFRANLAAAVEMLKAFDDLVWDHFHKEFCDKYYAFLARMEVGK